LFFNAHQRGRRLRVLAAGTIGATAVAASAFGAHWGSHGGDVGRSGHQAVDPTGPPVTLEYTADETNIRTSMVTSGGSDPSEQRIIYGTSDGRVHFRTLDSGAPAFATKVVQSPQYAPDADVFGSGTGVVSPVSSSSHDARGFTFQVYNEDAPVGTPTEPDVAVTVFDEDDGRLVDVVPIPGTTNYTVNDSPILFQNALWFVATPDPNPQIPPQDPTATPKLFKVNIGNPSGTGGSDPTVGSVKTINVSGATATAHPTGMWLKGTDGAPKPYVALGFGSGNTVRTFTADTVDPAAGPASGDLANGAAYTPSVPVLPNGETPQPGQAVETAPYIYVAVSGTDPISDYPGTQVVKLVQKADAPATLILAPEESNSSPILIGNAGNTIAVSQFANEPPAEGGFIALTTSCDVYTIDVGNMADAEPLLGPAAPDACADSTSASPATGFRRTAAAVSGNLGFVQRNNGDQIAFTLDRADQLPPDQFQEVDPQDATAAFGQPAISSRFVQFGDDKRVSVYGTSASLGAGEEGVGFAINDVTVTEGNSGQPKATFTITRTGTVGGSVQVTTADNTAKAGQDYTAASQRLTFSRADTTKTVDVPITPDVTGEPDETFYVRLSAPTGGGAHLVDAEGLGLITNDDPGNGLAIGITDTTAREGATANFTVSLTSAPSGPVTVDYITANGTAIAPGDYAATGGKLTFAAGQTTKTVGVPVRKDSKVEKVERFTLTLSNPTGATITDASGTGLIENVTPARRKARGFSARTTPTRDSAAPFVFVTTGKLTPPRGMSKSRACKGKVLVQVKSPRKTISARRVSLKRNCTYRSRVTFDERSRFQANGQLRFIARFLGNASVLRKSARTQTVNTR
jgi:hypothetical protein